MKIFDLVAASGHLDMLKYIESHMNDYFPNCFATTDAMDNAAAGMCVYICINYENSNVWFLNLSIFNMHVYLCHIYIFYTFAAGHLNVVEYLSLHRLQQEGCTADAMDLAAANGHLHVVQWLHHNR